MAIKITLKNSVVQDSVPTTSHLAAVGELALNANINSLGIYMRASDNSIVKMAGPGSVSTPAASTTVAGIAELATSAETTTGTDAARVVTPAGLKVVTDAERATSNSSYMTAAGGTLTGALTMPNGSNSAPSVNFGDSDSGIYGGTNTVSLAAGGTQGLTLNSSARVNIPTRLGVGVADPTHLIHIADDGGCGIAIEDTGHGFASSKIAIENGGRDLKITPPQDLIFENVNGETVRIDNAGRLLVGTSSARQAAGSSRLIQVEAVDATAGISVVRAGNNSNPSALVLSKTRGTSVGSTTIVQDNDALGIVRFVGADGTDLNSVGAEIKSIVDGTVAGNRMPGSLVFGTTADSAGSVSPTTRLTITSAGLVNIPDNGKFTAGASNDLAIWHSSSGTSNYLDAANGDFYIRINNAGSEEAVFCARQTGAAELFHSDVKKLETIDNGITVYGPEGGDGLVKIYADEGDDNADQWSLVARQAGGFVLRNYTDGAWEWNMAAYGGAGVDLYHNNEKIFETNASGVKVLNPNGEGTVTIEGGEGASATLYLYADQADDNNDKFRIRSTNGGNFWIENIGNGTTWEDNFKTVADGLTSLYFDSSPKLSTASDGITIYGAGSVLDGNFRVSGDDEYNFKLRHNSASYDTNISQMSDGVFRVRYGSDEIVRLATASVKVTSNEFVVSDSSAPSTALTSSPVQIVLDNITDHNWDHNEHCGAVIFKKGVGAAKNIVAAITGTHTRTGTGMANEDGGIQIWTSPSANPTVPKCRWEFSHNGELIGNGGHLVVNSEPDDRDEGQILLHPRATADDNDLIWVGTRDTSSSNYRFCVDGNGELRNNSSHYIGVQINEANAPTNHFNSADRIRCHIYRGTSDNANYRTRMTIGTASSDFDDYRCLYYACAQDDVAVDIDQDQTISMSGSGRINCKRSLWVGRVESDEATPNSVYRLGETPVSCYADDSSDYTFIYGRNVADTSMVFHSQVNGEVNVEIEADGSARTDGTWSDANADYAECFEWTDGNGSAEERRGMTVVLDGEKVKLATDSDNKDNIIGVVSPEPVVLGDAAPLGWHGRYKKDIYGSPIRKEQEWLIWKKEYHYEDGVKVLCAQPDPNKPQTLNGDMERCKVEDIERRKAQNDIPDFAITNNIRYKTYGKDIDKTDYDPSKPYVPRKDRKEWDAIGMLGKLVVRRGQPIGTRWLLLKEGIGVDTDGITLDRYLVR